MSTPRRRPRCCTPAGQPRSRSWFTRRQRRDVLPLTWAWWIAKARGSRIEKLLARRDTIEMGINPTKPLQWRHFTTTYDGVPVACVAKLD